MNADLLEYVHSRYVEWEQMFCSVVGVVFGLDLLRLRLRQRQPAAAATVAVTSTAVLGRR